MFRPRHALSTILPAVLLALAGCGDDTDAGGEYVAPADCSVVLRPGTSAQTQVQEALIGASTGDVVCFAPGTFAFSEEISLSVDGVKIRGAGMSGADATIFDFDAQTAGAQGMDITGDDFVMEDIAVKNTRGDGVRVTAATGVTFRRVRVSWDGPDGTPDAALSTNGAYALYPVESTDVLIEGCEIVGAADAGVYVGQSRNVIVRDNIARKNVAGIEIENCIDADVYGNEAFDNTAGILVFDLPNLVTIPNGRTTRLHDNDVYENNRRNFAAVGIIGLVPDGIGVMILAGNDVEMDANDVRDNGTTAVLVVSYEALISLAKESRPAPPYDTWNETLNIHDNTFTNNGRSPSSNALVQVVIAATQPDVETPVLEDILYDGYANPDHAGMDDKRLCIRGNTSQTFIIFDAADVSTKFIDGGTAEVMVSRDLAPHDCTHPAHGPVVIAP